VHSSHRTHELLLSRGYANTATRQFKEYSKDTHEDILSSIPLLYGVVPTPHDLVPVLSACLNPELIIGTGGWVAKINLSEGGREIGSTKENGNKNESDNENDNATLKR